MSLSMRGLSLTRLSLEICLLLFAASALLSMTTSYAPELGQGAVITILASTVLVFVLIYPGRARHTSRAVAGVGVAAATALAVYFITQFRYQNYPETPTIIERLGNLTTLLPNLGLGGLHPNAVATVLEVMLPVSLGLAASTRHHNRRLVWSVCALIMAYAVVLSVSRGSWVGLIVVAGVGALVLILKALPPNRAATLAIIIAAIMALGLLALIILGPRLPFVVEAVEAAGRRLELYRNTIYLARDYLYTGIGLGDTFAMVYSRFGLLIFVPFVTYTSNLPLAIWLGQGLLGLLAFFGMILFFYVYTIRAVLRANPSGLFYGAWLGVTATLIHGLADARQYLESPWIMPALFVGIGLATAGAARAMHRLEEDIRLEPRSWLLRGGLVAAGFTALAIFFLVFNAPIRALWIANQAALEETRGDTFIVPSLTQSEHDRLTAMAADLYRQALVIDPNLPTASRRLGNLLVGQGVFDEAVPLLENAVDQEPVNPAAIKGLGLAYVWKGRTEEAARMLARLTDPPAMVNELFTWAQFRGEQGEMLLSAYALETAVIMSSPDPNPNLDVWLLMADRFREGGDIVRARRWYNTILDRNPGNAGATEGLAALGG